MSQPDSAATCMKNNGHQVLPSGLKKNVSKKTYMYIIGVRVTTMPTGLLYYRIERLYYYGFQVNVGIDLILVIQIFYPSHVSVL